MAPKAKTITVEAAHPQAFFYQEVVDEDTGKLVVEHVFAPTDEESGEQLPVAMEVHDTARLRRALAEVQPDTSVGDSAGLPARIVESEGSPKPEHTLEGRRTRYGRDLEAKRSSDAQARKDSNAAITTKQETKSPA